MAQRPHPPAAKAEPQREHTGVLLVVLARQMIQRVGEALGPAQIPFMPLKGALLQTCVYDDPNQRGFWDVDVLVPERQFDRAVNALTGVGLWVVARASHAHTMMSPDHVLPLDLHRQPFPPRMFRLPADELFNRSRASSSDFGVPVQMPNPYDLYAHLVGSFAKGRLDRRQPQQLEDLVQVARRYELVSTKVAQRLARLGLARAARYTLDLGQRRGDRFAASVLLALPSDPLGRVCATAARLAFESAAQPSRRAAVARHLLNHSLPAASRSLAAHLLDAATRG